MRPSGQPLSAAKWGLRRSVLSGRRGLDPTAVRDAGTALARAVLPSCRDAATVALYAAVGTEPPTGPLLEALAGVRVLLPVLRDDGDLDWAEHRPGSALVAAPRGLLEPAGPRLGRQALSGCDVVVVPALAVDRSGRRLGRGGGSYDRALARARGLVVALLHDGELLHEVPAEPHDAGVDAVATPSGGLVRLTPAGDPGSRPDIMGA